LVSNVTKHLQDLFSVACHRIGLNSDLFGAFVLKDLDKPSDKTSHKQREI
jgi:hypothetical protein